MQKRFRTIENFNAREKRNIDHIIGDDPRILDDLPDNYFTKPLVSPRGENNVMHMTYNIDTDNIKEEVFLEYLANAKTIQHYIGFQGEINTAKGKKYQLYRVPYDEFIQQLNSLFQISSETLMLANRSNGIRKGVIF